MKFPKKDTFSEMGAGKNLKAKLVSYRKKTCFWTDLGEPHRYFFLVSNVGDRDVPKSASRAILTQKGAFRPKNCYRQPESWYPIFHENIVDFVVFEQNSKSSIDTYIFFKLSPKITEGPSKMPIFPKKDPPKKNMVI